MLPIINRNCMVSVEGAYTKSEIIEKMVGIFDKEGYLFDKEEFHKDILAREEVFSTYIGFEIGLPHGKSNAVKEAGIAVAKLDQPVVWNEEDSVDLIIMIAVQPEGADLHLQVLSKLSRMLMHEDFRDHLKNDNLDDLYALLNEKLA